MRILAGQAALDIGNHQLLADLGHGGQLATAGTNRQPVFSRALPRRRPMPAVRGTAFRWEDAQVAEDAAVEQARILVGLLRDEIAEISDKLKRQTATSIDEQSTATISG
jgi:hypothetical protein